MNKKVIGAIIALVVLVGCGDNQEEITEQGSAQPSDNAVTYNCEGEIVKVDFNNDVEPNTANLFVQGAEMTLSNVETASGAKYSDGDITFWTHQGEATLAMESTGDSLNCVEESAEENNNEEIVDANGNIVTDGCEAWFDGCNNCQVNPDGMMACTRMMCAPETIKPARCMDEESIENDKTNCANAGGVWSEEHNSCFEDPSTMAGEGEK